jgi:hypothetical protein
MDIDLADTMPDGGQHWLDWHRMVAPGNAAEIKAIEAVRGNYFGYVRLVDRRGAEANLDEPIVCIPKQYTKMPLLRSEER